MVSPLILDSVEINGFRAFRHLRIEHLGRVNLIVGKNNVGKTSFLDAIWLYAYGGSPQIIWQILEAHEERTRPSSISPSVAESKLSTMVQNTLHNYRVAGGAHLLAFKFLFNGRPNIRKKIEPIQIGPANSPDHTLSLRIGWWYVELSSLQKVH